MLKMALVSAALLTQQMAPVVLVAQQPDLINVMPKMKVEIVVMLTVMMVLVVRTRLSCVVLATFYQL